MRNAVLRGTEDSNAFWQHLRRLDVAILPSSSQAPMPLLYSSIAAASGLRTLQLHAVSAHNFADPGMSGMAAQECSVAVYAVSAVWLV